jgi:hypothetical protein
MRAERIIMRVIVSLFIAMFAMPSAIPAQDSDQPEQSDRFKKEELAQMLASIALYPDSLIADILMASTYPLEVVEAERWLRQNQGLKGDALNDALQEKTWDASIKTLCNFPDVLYAMSDKLDQTRKLGDAFISQQEDVMDTIQELRRRAREQGNLTTTREQSVIEDESGIRIEPADPQVVYVPVYDPFYVYGPWWYPAYPPYYWYYPPGVIVTGGFISFAPAFFVGIDILLWYWPDWRYHSIHIDHDRKRRFYRDRHDSDRPFWHHDPSHRRGVAYRDRRTSERFGGPPSRVHARSHETRGYPERIVVRPPSAPSPGHVIRREQAPPPRTRMEKPGVRERDIPFQGVGNGNFERRASERGGMSRRSEGEHRRGGDIQRQDRKPDRDGKSRGDRRDDRPRR